MCQRNFSGRFAGGVSSDKRESATCVTNELRLNPLRLTDDGEALIFVFIIYLLQSFILRSEAALAGDCICRMVISRTWTPGM